MLLEYDIIWYNRRPYNCSYRILEITIFAVPPRRAKTWDAPGPFNVAPFWAWCGIWLVHDVIYCGEVPAHFSKIHDGSAESF